eukprot:TRINITY_DN2210_c0_g1_i2.p1 TRINITY_DN2210_c0_g1~~TRINITY_DN2210_c0_g1_i2.p1  ORF type:complete len:733 (+),score=137.49 TRINITY_DN2210_c0_g1_i2:22-2199(+)
MEADEPNEIEIVKLLRRQLGEHKEHLAGILEIVENSPGPGEGSPVLDGVWRSRPPVVTPIVSPPAPSPLYPSVESKTKMNVSPERQRSAELMAQYGYWSNRRSLSPHRRVMTPLRTASPDSPGTPPSDEDIRFDPPRLECPLSALELALQHAPIALERRKQTAKRNSTHNTPKDRSSELVSPTPPAPPLISRRSSKPKAEPTPTLTPPFAPQPTPPQPSVCSEEPDPVPPPAETSLRKVAPPQHLSQKVSQAPREEVQHEARAQETEPPWDHGHGPSTPPSEPSSPSPLRGGSPLTAEAVDSKLMESAERARAPTEGEDPVTPKTPETPKEVMMTTMPQVKVETPDELPIPPPAEEPPAEVVRDVEEVQVGIAAEEQTNATPPLRQSFIVPAGRGVGDVTPPSVASGRGRGRGAPATPTTRNRANSFMPVGETVGNTNIAATPRQDVSPSKAELDLLLHKDDDTVSGLVTQSLVLESVEMNSPASRSNIEKGLGMRVVYVNGEPVPSQRELDLILMRENDVALGLNQTSLVVTDSVPELNGVYGRARLTDNDTKNQVRAKFKKQAEAAIIYYSLGLWRMNTTGSTSDWKASSKKLVGKWQQIEGKDVTNIPPTHYPAVFIPDEAVLQLSGSLETAGLSFTGNVLRATRTQAAKGYLGWHLVRLNQNPVDVDDFALLSRTAHPSKNTLFLIPPPKVSPQSPNVKKVEKLPKKDQREVKNEQCCDIM